MEEMSDGEYSKRESLSDLLCDVNSAAVEVDAVGAYHHSSAALASLERENPDTTSGRPPPVGSTDSGRSRPNVLWVAETYPNVLWVAETLAEKVENHLRREEEVEARDVLRVLELVHTGAAYFCGRPTDWPWSFQSKQDREFVAEALDKSQAGLTVISAGQLEPRDAEILHKARMNLRAAMSRIDQHVLGRESSKAALPGKKRELPSAGNPVRTSGCDEERDKKLLRLD
ncbi:unnamed protein product [Symbiodinium sp. CCMP2592]|nr:unnamed protein product [Symbiodinium sp. CCMP2592]